MTERDLETLKHSAVPPAREEARRAAIGMALDAFDAAPSQHQEIDDAAKGTAVAARPTRTTSRTRSFLMGLTSRQNLALAASLAALVIVAPIAFKTYQDKVLGLRPPQREVVSVASTPSEQKKKKLSVETATSEPPRDEKESIVAKSVVPAERPNDGAAGVRSNVLAPTPEPAPPPAQPRMADSVDQSLAAGGLYDSQNLASRFRGRSMLQGLLNSDDDQLERSAIASPYKNRDIFNSPDINPVKQVATDPVSTFSVDVDTASYSFLRRALNSGHLPPKEAVRVEELINYFPYAYPAPESADVPFKPTVTVMPAPWKPTDKLVHIAIKGYDLKRAERPRANLVFLLDVSGSMEPEDRLPLVKNALRLFLDQLQPDDTVGIVTYASGSGIALEPTKISDKAKILAAIDKLEAGGSTNGAGGIEDAYRLAEAGFDKKAVNRIILATDGDFNVGMTDRAQLQSYIERKRKSGVLLSILGVGQGNHNDALMQALAQNGNGTAAYVDTLNEARKVLVDEASSTLFTIAKDVKAQIEWNPARIAEYRLIGYETRALKREDFNNDQVDAGDIGSGHTVTAIYEVTPVGAPQLVDNLRYGKATTSADAASRQTVKPAGDQPATNNAGTSELGFLKLRYKRPNEDTSQLITLPITDALEKPAITDVPPDVRFSVAVAAFGDLVRGAPFTSGFTYDDILALAQTARGDDPYGYRAEFLNLVRLARSARP
jgi:Ca-activated chloride channel family protein